MSKEIDTIINGDYTVNEKLKLILKYKEEMLEEINNALVEVKKGYKYCEKCGQWYKERAWEREELTEKREYCKFRPLAEWEDPEYAVGEFKVEYEICPLGHKVEKSRWQVA